MRKLDACSFAFGYPCAADVRGAIAMFKSISIAVVCGLAAFVVADRTAFAQAGSTGGTLTNPHQVRYRRPT
jgi:hypothetical protein